MNESLVLELIENQEVGITRAELEARLGLAPDARQRLLRLLRSLQAAGKLRFEGATKNRRYFAAGARTPDAPSTVPLSFEAREALALIERPLSARPVSYRRELLDGYRASGGFLSAAVRARLLELGTTPERHQPAGTYARRVLERLLLDLSWNSSRLEGNTYSLLDTERLLTAGATADGASATETQMLLNHKAAIEFLVAEPMTAAVDERTVKTLHALLLENLLSNRLDEGRLRVTSVSIGQSAYLPLANAQLIDECFRQLVIEAQAIVDPFEQAFFLLAHLPYLQPFLDGNKRTARLAANLPFIAQNLVPLSFADVPRELFLKSYLALYELGRVEPLRDVFVWAYERSVARLSQVTQALGTPDPFRLQHRQALREVVAAVVRQQLRGAPQRALLKKFAEQRLAPDQHARFIAMAEVELETLHDGTFPRYGLRPSEFEAWLTTAGGRR